MPPGPSLDPSGLSRWHRSAQSSLNRCLASSCSAPEAQRGQRGMCPAPSWMVTGAPSRTKRDTAVAVRFWPGELVSGTVGWRVPDTTDAPSRQTGEWRGGAPCLRARWQKPPSYRARKQTYLPEGRPPVPPDVAQRQGPRATRSLTHDCKTAISSSASRRIPRRDATRIPRCRAATRASCNAFLG
jgi:hypothetical protein